MVADSSQKATTPVSGAATAEGFRRDIQGVRGFALVLVLACHAGIPLAEGGFVGLDIFFVLSGFLITGLILKEVQRTGGVSLLRFYARRARRLLPLAVTVLAVILVLAAVLFTPIRAYETSWDAVAAALYVVNWRYVVEAVDYFAFEDPDVSPVQHYWSLSVEEQFYLLWPLLIFVAIALFARNGRSVRPALWGLVATIGLGSLAYSIWYSAVDIQAAYFSSLTRVWEILVGCALALALPAGLRMPRLLSGALAAGGLAVLVWATVAFTNDVPYPGWRALAPTLATAAIIVAGTAGVRSRPIALLCVAPLQYLGKISYAWYLWHWPALVFAATVWGPLTMAQNIVVTLAAWVPTIVTHHLIEERYRHSRTLARRPRRAIAVGLGCTASATALGLLVAGAQNTVPVAKGSEVEGAKAIEQGELLQTSATAIRPDLREAEEDRGPMFDDGCHLKNDARDTSPECVYGEPGSKRRVVLFGDSHGLQYAPAMLKLAKRRSWRLVSLTRGGCTPADVAYRPGCDRWRESSMRRIERERPRLVVLSTGTGNRYDVKVDGERLDREASEPYLAAGLTRTLRRLRATGAKVVVIRDQARAPFNVAACVSDHVDDLAECSFRPKRSSKLAHDAKAARRVRGVKLVDPLKLLCPDDRCPAVIGNALVYRNTYHLSATFAETMAPWLGRRLPRL